MFCFDPLAFLLKYIRNMCAFSVFSSELQRVTDCRVTKCARPYQSRKSLMQCPSLAADRLADAVGFDMMKYIATCRLSIGSFGQLHSSSLEADPS
jgi:hypothetical protein